MKKLLIIFALALTTTIAFAQDNLQVTLDSILQEAETLYRYEKVAWNATDIISADEELKSKYATYVVYHLNDKTSITFIDNTLKNRFARYSFTNSNLNVPFLSEIETAPLSELETELLEMKLKIIDKLSDSKYDVNIPKEYTPNIVLIKDTNEYRLYILMGTTNFGIIPFGNDYLFKSDYSGSITDWKKFHSRILPVPCKTPDGDVILSATHSHLKTTPYITATDICTFKLYSDICDQMKELKVLCLASNKYYTYNIETNQIAVEDLQ